MSVQADSKMWRIPLSRRAFTMSSLIAAGGLIGRPAIGNEATQHSPLVESLIARMTVEEKVGQLTLYPDEVRPTPRPINPDINAQAAARNRAQEQILEIRAGRVGSLLGGTGVDLGRTLQHEALKSRLGIPLLFGADILHGLRTIFPIPLALASSFEPKLAEMTAQSAATEATAVGIHWTYAPMVDVARDQRWGRVAEGSGEDVHLCSLFAAAYVRGFQQGDLRSPRALAACPKHFAGYGAVVGGMDYNSTDITERELRETHLPTFKAAIDAGALTIMAAFNDLDGVPASGNRHLLTEILRDEWGFEGFVVSDAASAEELVPHGFAIDEREAAMLALTAGLDMNMGGGIFRRHLPELLTSGSIEMSVLDEAVRRVLQVKEAIGLFQNPYKSLDPRRERGEIRTPAAQSLAREAARRSIVLLRNDAQTLPLKSGAKVALIGPLGDDPAHLDGTWAPWARTGEGVTLADALRREPGIELSVVKGSNILEAIEGGLDAAINVAKHADVVLLAIGEGQDMSGEAHSRSIIDVPAPQRELVEAVAATGKPIVVLLSCGRALALEGAIAKANAIAVTWFLGSQSGPAICDVLLGRFAPCGRLPVSFPQSAGQQPFYYNHKSTGRPQLPGEDKRFKARYDDVSNQALFAFGSGLTYSTIVYGRPTLSSAALDWNGKISVSSLISNSGTSAAEEVVQLYVRDVAATVTRPVRQLKGFKKITLAPGQVAQVTFEVTRAELEFVGRDLKRRAEPGEFQLWIAADSASGDPVTFQLKGAQ